MRRIVALVLAGVLVLAVLVTIVVSRGGGAKHLTVVHGVIGSEKKPFFDDADVKKAFAKKGYDVQVDTAGSRAMATTTDLTQYDFAFPAGTPTAQKIQRDHKANATYVPFFTPMAIATFDPIAQLLTQAGVAHKDGDTYRLDVKAFLDLVKDNKRWNQLPNNTSYPVSKSVLVTSTDIQTSNSAAMYASIASYVANGNNVLDGPDKVDSVIPVVSPLFTRQGFAESSSDAPFEDYLSIGIGKTPMVMVYEAQFVDRAAQHDGSITKDMVLMYPDPDVLSKHTLVPLSDKGDKVGRLLTDDPTLQHLAVVHGFRTSNRADFTSFVKTQRVAVASDVLDIIEPPTYETLEQLIVTISKELHGPQAQSVTTTTRSP